MFIKTYSDFSLSKVGVRSDFVGPRMGAHFKLDNDVSSLFPYINATVKDAKFYDAPEYIQFTMDDILCTLYPMEAMAVPFAGPDHALGFANRFIDFLNHLHTQKDTLKPNYNKVKPPVSAIDIYKLLPQTNCKKCGYQTCVAFAAALSKNKTTPDQCPDFSKPISQSATYPVFDKKGSLKTTVSIEIDPKKREIDLVNQKKQIETIEKKLRDLEQEQKVLLENNQHEIQTDLTGREIEVLRLMAKGATNTEISNILSISPHTVKSHVVHIFNKLGVNDRTQAAVWATRQKIV
jgi:DNA-binding CsgD family transcriptional regulator/ArsR family metal-binding transcriptional regulator